MLIMAKVRTETTPHTPDMGVGMHGVVCVNKRGVGHHFPSPSKRVVMAFIFSHIQEC